MVEFDGVRRGRAVAVSIAAAMIGGALLAPTAEADDGTAPLAELTAPASDAVEAASEMLATVPVDIDVTEGETPAVVEDADPSEGAPSVATTPTSTAASEPETGDTRAEDSDTIADTGLDTTPAPPAATTPAPSSTTPQPPAAPKAAAPTNVNISIRIDSAGDDAPVTQINVTVAPSAADQGTSGAPAEPARPAASSPAEPPAASDTGAGSSEASVVDWIRNCLGLAAIPTTVSPTESTANHDTKSRSPSWNCGDNRTPTVSGASQYRPEIIDQYRPMNMNVSIRISSPGDNGPVSQTNIMVALGGGGQQASASETPGAGAVAVAIHVDLPPITVTFAASSMPSVAEAAPVGVISLPVLEAETLELWPAGVYPRPASIVFLESDAPVGRPSLGQRWPTAVEAPVHGVAGLHASQVAFWPGANSTELDGRPSRSAPAGRRTTRPPRVSAPGKSIVLRGSAPAGTSVAPASGGSSSGGGLPVFLLFPFIAVMLDLARRVVASCLTWPSGHRARMPDTPG